MLNFLYQNDYADLEPSKSGEEEEPHSVDKGKGRAKEEVELKSPARTPEKSQRQLPQDPFSAQPDSWHHGAFSFDTIPCVHLQPHGAQDTLQQVTDSEDYEHETERIVLHVEMYRMGDFYDIPALRALAISRYTRMARDSIPAFIESIAGVLRRGLNNAAPS